MARHWDRRLRKMPKRVSVKAFSSLASNAKRNECRQFLGLNGASTSSPRGATAIQLFRGVSENRQPVAAAIHVGRRCSERKSGQDGHANCPKHYVHDHEGTR